MEVSELRIGNFIQVYRKPEDKVKTAFNIKSIYYEDNFLSFYAELADGFCVNIDTGIEPIVPTEEWLIKLGFEKTDYKWNDNSISKNIFLITGGWCHYAVQFTRDGIVFFRIRSNREQEFITAIEYIHQLQNVCYILRKEELKLKL
jgi:hypothetical protein